MENKIRTAMLLAAGYGTRLKPLTDTTPKPLIPVAGKPMMEYALEHLQAYGIGRVVINVSHLKEVLVKHVSARSGLSLVISEESEPLETGGGLKKALPLLGREPFFAINSDIIWVDRGERALDRLAKFWDGSRMDFLLLAQSKAAAVGHDKGEDHLFIKPENTFEWDEAQAPYIIAGLGIVHPRVLENAPDGKFSIKILWRQAMAEGRLWCLPHRGQWFQTGSEKDIRSTEAILGTVPTQEPSPPRSRQ